MHGSMTMLTQVILCFQLVAVFSSSHILSSSQIFAAHRLSEHASLAILIMMTMKMRITTTMIQPATENLHRNQLFFEHARNLKAQAVLPLIF